jgi:hypothetical protein
MPYPADLPHQIEVLRDLTPRLWRAEARKLLRKVGVQVVFRVETVVGWLGGSTQRRHHSSMMTIDIDGWTMPAMCTRPHKRRTVCCRAW